MGFACAPPVWAISGPFSWFRRSESEYQVYRSAPSLFSILKTSLNPAISLTSHSETSSPTNIHECPGMMSRSLLVCEVGTRSEANINILPDGEAAHDVLLNFVQRWNISHKTRLATTYSTRLQSEKLLYQPFFLHLSFTVFWNSSWSFSSFTGLPKAALGRGDTSCQITRSIAPSYCGELFPESSICEAYVDAITKAPSYICIFSFIFCCWSLVYTYLTSPPLSTPLLSPLESSSPPAPLSFLPLYFYF